MEPIKNTLLRHIIHYAIDKGEEREWVVKHIITDEDGWIATEFPNCPKYTRKEIQKEIEAMIKQGELELTKGNVIF